MGAAAGPSIGVMSELSSAYSQSKALEAQGEYQKTMYDLNADAASAQSQDATRRGDKAAAESVRRANQALGSQRAAMGASGVSVDSGSARDVQAETAQASAMDTMTLKTNAWREAWGYKVQASQYNFQGRMAKLAAESGAKQTLLTGGLRATGIVANSIPASSSGKPPAGK